jgi:hypothetical protein
VLAVALLAALLAITPMRAARASGPLPGRGAHPVAQDHQRGQPDGVKHVHPIAHVFLDKHAVDALFPDVPATGRSDVGHEVVRPASRLPLTASAEVCSRGPPAGERIS